MGAVDTPKALDPDQQRVFEEHLDLAKKVAARLAPQISLPRDELENVGRIALWNLAATWFEGARWSFSGTAEQRIERAMRDENRAQHPELERARSARRRREARGEPEPTPTAQPQQRPSWASDPLVDGPPQFDVIDSTTSMSKKIGRKRTAELVLEAADHLPEAERELVVALLMSDISNREYARRTGQSPATIDRRLRKVTEKLQKICKRRGIEW